MDAKIQQFIANLVDEFQMDEARLNEMWKMIETPVTTTTTGCSHMFTKGTKEGEQCGKTVKKGDDFCATHGKKSKKVSFSCNHFFTKGTKEGKKCTVKVATENGRCSKHTIPDENDKKLSLKKWEEILFSQIPEILVTYYKEEQDYLEDAKLTRKTANNVAAWIMIKYETYFIHEDPAKYFNGRVDFHEEMRTALVSSDTHPAKKPVEYFYDEAHAPDESDPRLYKMYKRDMEQYDLAKKIYASQYP